MNQAHEASIKPNDEKSSLTPSTISSPPSPLNQSSPASEIKLSEDQQLAFDRIKDWLEEPSEKLQLSLGGYAGTGKTTLLKKLLDGRHRVAVMAFTGKAVSVLRKKGLYNAQTIHSSIYYVIVIKKKLFFTLRSEIDGYPNFIVVDEASMISTLLFKDLQSFGLPILWVGDHGQLEPVGENPGVMLNPDIRLEKIHRQAENNPIIMFADKVRRGNAPGAIHQKKDEPTIVVKLRSQLTDDDLTKAEQVICAINRTRVQLNRRIRSKLCIDKAESNDPKVGDKVICLKNNRRFGVFNGLQGKILELSADPNWPVYEAKIELDTNQVTEVEIAKAQFNMVKGLCDLDSSLKDTTHWDFAYAVTCHKAQGSEWPSVVVIEETCPLWSMARWRYTAVTRASERLVYAV